MRKTRLAVSFTIISSFLIISSLTSCNTQLINKNNLNTSTLATPSQLITLKADLAKIEAGEESQAMLDVEGVINNRLQAIGFPEFDIEQQSRDKLVVELFGYVITDEQITQLCYASFLEFGEQVVDPNDPTIKWKNELGSWKPATGTFNGQEIALTSSFFEPNTYVITDPFGYILLVFEWDGTGSQLSEQITSRLINKPLGIFEGDHALMGEDGKPLAPIVQGVIKSKGQITGLGLNEANILSKQLNAGRLPIPLSVFESKILDSQAPMLPRNPWILFSQ